MEDPHPRRNEKREELDTKSWQEVNDWYYTDDEDESDYEEDEDEEDFLESLQLTKNVDGELTFISKYIESLKNIPIHSI